MAQHFLHRAQIAATLQHMAGKAVAQHVWLYAKVNAMHNRPFF